MKLKEEKAALDATDTIGIFKDGKSRKATYYDHIHTLFSLYRLSEAETDIMRNLALAPLSGVQNRLFANFTMGEISNILCGIKVHCHSCMLHCNTYG